MKKYFSNLAAIGLLAALYFYTGKLGLSLALVHPSATAVWPPSGIALAAVLLLGYGVWPGILLGAFLVNLTTEGSVATSAGIALGNTLEPLLGAFLVNRFAEGSNAFARTRNIFNFVVLAGMVSTMVSATFGVTSLSLGGFAFWEDYGSIWLTWWLGDMASDLIVAPLLLVWSTKSFPRLKIKNVFEGLFLLLLVFLTGQIVFGGWLPTYIKNYPLSFLSIPPLLLLAYRFGQHGATVGTLVMSVAAIWGTLRGLGPFAVAEPNESLLLLQGFMATIAVTVLVLAAVVTERSRTQTALSESEQRFRYMADSAPVLIWINGQSGCEFVNRTYLAFTGRTVGESLGMGWTVDLHPGDAKQYIESFQKAFEARVPFEAQFRFRRADGEYRWLKSIGLPRFAGSGGFLGYVGCSIDISDLKRSEEALRRSEEKSRQQAQELERQLIASGRLVSLGEITASMAHEFNNPLGIIMGFAQDLLSETDPPSPNYRALKIINEETKRCEKIIRDLLEYSRPKISEVRPTDVKQVVEKSLNLVENHLYKQKIKTTVQVESNLPKIYADPQQIEQVLVNLYLNAIDAMPEGGRLIVRASLNSSSTADGPSRQVRVAVADTGFGIESEDLPKIFQPFFTAKKTRGLGLGLSVCERIIRNHGGRIEAESVPGRGATFKIYLPVDRSQPAENQPSKI